jgi:hypothetical protein
MVTPFLVCNVANLMFIFYISKYFGIFFARLGALRCYAKREIFVAMQHVAGFQLI